MGESGRLPPCRSHITAGPGTDTAGLSLDARLPPDAARQDPDATRLARPCPGPAHRTPGNGPSVGFSAGRVLGPVCHARGRSFGAVAHPWAPRREVRERRLSPSTPDSPGPGLRDAAARGGPLAVLTRDSHAVGTVPASRVDRLTGQCHHRDTARTDRPAPLSPAVGRPPARPLAAALSR